MADRSTAWSATQPWKWEPSQSTVTSSNPPSAVDRLAPMRPPTTISYSSLLTTPYILGTKHDDTLVIQHPGTRAGHHPEKDHPGVATGAHTAAVEAREDDGHAADESRPLREVGAAPHNDPAPPLPPVEETDEGALERGIDLVIGATARGVRWRASHRRGPPGHRGRGQPTGRPGHHPGRQRPHRAPGREGATVRGRARGRHARRRPEPVARVVPAVIETIDPTTS